MYVKQQQPQQQQPVGYVQPYQLETDKWREKFPASVPSLLAVLQLLLTLSIVGLEAASVYYDLVHGTIYAGFWCSAIFTISWIAMFGLLCCRRSKCCATYLLVQNIICLAFSCVLLAFDVVFINNVCQCYFGSTVCSNINGVTNTVVYSSDGSTCTSPPYSKVPFLKGQLACAVLMLASNIVYIIVYIAVSISVNSATVTPSRR